MAAPTLRHAENAPVPQSVRSFHQRLNKMVLYTLCKADIDKRYSSTAAQVLRYGQHARASEIRKQPEND